MASRIKHKKLKNTGLLYELLIRQATSDVLQGKTPDSINLVKKYFKKDSPLHEELKLYNTLINQKISDSNFALKIIDAAIATRSKIPQDKLDGQKYQLVKEITSKYDSDSFFRTKIDSYQVYASICNLLENIESDNPNDYIKNKITVAKNILTPINEDKQVQKTLSQDIDPDLKVLTFKKLTEKFNNKWVDLGSEQKQVIRHFILNTVDSPETREFINENVKVLRNSFKIIMKNSDDKVLKIKLQEVYNLLDKVSNSKFVTEDSYLTIIKYYELLNELKK